MNDQAKRGKHFKTQPEEPVSKDEVSFPRLAFQCMGELWLFQFVASSLLWVLLTIMKRVTWFLLSLRGVVLTTANVDEVLLSWQGVLISLISISTIALYVTIDLFAHIYYCDGLLKGSQDGIIKHSLNSVKKAFLVLPRFLTPTGFPTLIYISILVPILGVGFSIGITRDFYIPTFIMDVIKSTHIYLVLYFTLMLILAVIGVLHIFMVHGVLLDDLKPNPARRNSRTIIRNHPKQLLKSVVSSVIASSFATLLLGFAFFVAFAFLSDYGDTLPAGYQVDLVELIHADTSPSDLDIQVMLFRSASIFVVMLGSHVFEIVTMFVNFFTVLLSVHLYHWLGEAETDDDHLVKPRYPRRVVKQHRVLLGLGQFGVIALFVAMSLLFGCLFDQIIRRTDAVDIVAHRLGGSGAPENSIRGLGLAIQRGCYGAETDVQRTSDGYYIINHDESFKRLAGVDAAPKDLTLDEVRELRLVDRNFPDEELTVPTLEEVLDVSIKSDTILFIELKGSTADQQMVDDVVRIVRERDAVDKVALISLNYNCISYAETTYPEIKTGLLIFGQFGNLALLNCDMILTEEEAATDQFILSAHDAGKDVGVWTVNSKQSLQKFLDKDIELVITDQLILASEVQQELDGRDDMQLIVDEFGR